MLQLQQHNGMCQMNVFSQIYATLWLQPLCSLRAPSRHAFALAQHSSESEPVTERRWPQSPQPVRLLNLSLTRTIPGSTGLRCNHCRQWVSLPRFDLSPLRKGQNKISQKREETATRYTCPRQIRAVRRRRGWHVSTRTHANTHTHACLYTQNIKNHIMNWFFTAAWLPILPF